MEGELNTFLLTVSTPDGNVFEEQIRELIVRGAEGDLAVLPGHAPMTTFVNACVCRIVTDNDELIKVRTDGGLLSVGDGGAVFLCSGFEEE